MRQQPAVTEERHALRILVVTFPANRIESRRRVVCSLDDVARVLLGDEDVREPVVLRIDIGFGATPSSSSSPNVRLRFREWGIEPERALEMRTAGAPTPVYQRISGNQRT